MKSVYQIAQQILDDWPYASGIKSAHKTLLVAMIAEKLSEQEAGRISGWMERGWRNNCPYERTMKHCLNCKWADWAKTATGRNHPSGEGRCKYPWEMPVLPASMYWIGYGSGIPTPSGGFISRKEELKYHCAYFSRSER